MRNWISQVSYILRKLVKAPVFTGVSILTLGLAIGANTAIFSVVNSVLLEPLPFEDPERLVGVWHEAPGLNFDKLSQSPALHFAYVDHNTAFEDIGMYDRNSASTKERSRARTPNPQSTSSTRRRSGA